MLVRIGGAGCVSRAKLPSQRHKGLKCLAGAIDERDTEQAGGERLQANGKQTNRG